MLSKYFDNIFIVKLAELENLSRFVLLQIYDRIFFPLLYCVIAVCLCIFSAHPYCWSIFVRQKTELPMKHHQQQQAYTLYLSGEYTNMQIAEIVSVNRRTIMLWARQGGWHRQRELRQQLPHMLLKRSYQLADTFTSGLLHGKMGEIRLKHAKTIHYLANGINVLNVNDNLLRTRMLRAMNSRLSLPLKNRCA